MPTPIIGVGMPFFVSPSVADEADERLRSFCRIRARHLCRVTKPPYLSLGPDYGVAAVRAERKDSTRNETRHECRAYYYGTSVNGRRMRHRASRQPAVHSKTAVAGSGTAARFPVAAATAVIPKFSRHS